MGTAIIHTTKGTVMVKLSLSKEIAERAEKKFPDYEITFDLPGRDIAPEVKFRNLIRLSEDERKKYHAVAREVQEELREALATARKAIEDGDADAISELNDRDQTRIMVGVLRDQLVVLAEDAELARECLAEVDDATLLTVHTVVTEDVASGE